MGNNGNGRHEGPSGWTLKTLAAIPTVLLLLSTNLGATAAAAEPKKTPIILEKTGGFVVGGKVLNSPFAPNQTLSCDHGYMEYFIPWRHRKTSIVMWHSSHTQTWQNNWAGGEGFKDIYLRRNYPVYLYDAPRLGRANWGCAPYRYDLDYRDKGNFVAWNFGPVYPQWWPGVQFPTKDPEAWNQATRARYIEFDNEENIDVQSNATVAAVDSGKLGKSVVFLTNSASGLRALYTQIKSTTKNIKAVVVYEPIGNVFTDDVELPANWTTPGFGPFRVPVEQYKKLTKIPIQFVWGDNRPDSWLYVNQSHKVASLINQYGGNAQVLKLGEKGFNGTTHVSFADLNNHKIAGVLDNFLAKYGLDEYEDEDEDED